MKGPSAFVPPGNFQAPVVESSSNNPGTFADLVASFPRPERSLTVVVVPNEFRSEEL